MIHRARSGRQPVNGIALGLGLSQRSRRLWLVAQLVGVLVTMALVSSASPSAALAGGGYGGGGLPLPAHVLELWGGTLSSQRTKTPGAPRVVSDDGTGAHEYALIAVDAEGRRTAQSSVIIANGIAKLAWDSVAGAEEYVVVRDGQELAAVRVEGSEKVWQDAK